MSKIAPKLGLAVFDTRLTLDALQEGAIVLPGAGVLQSAYTESGPVPGIPVSNDTQSDWRPQLSGAQTVDRAFYTIQGGYAGRDGAAVLQTSALGIGWEEPVTVTDWTAPADGWGASETWSAFAATVIRETGVLIVATTDSGNVGKIWSYNPRTGTWTVLEASFALRAPLGLVYDEDKSRLILYSGRTPTALATAQLAYYSDDAGANWALYSKVFAPDHTGDADGAWRIVPHPTGDWLGLVIDEVDGTGAAYHMASSDRGGTWQKAGGVSDNPGGVATAVPDDGTGAFPVLGPSGFVIFYIDTSSSAVVCKLLPTAQAPINDATQVVIDSGRNYSVVWGACDFDGMLYAFALGTSGASNKDKCYVFRSLDGGSTWTEYVWDAWMMTSQTRYVDVYDVVPSCGHLYMLASNIGETGTDGTLSLIQLGGWSHVATGAGTDTLERASRIGWGRHNATDTWGIVWLPWAPPEDIGWTRDTATGTRTFSVSFADAGLELTTTAGQGEVYHYAYGTNADYMCGQAVLQVGSSGSATLATIGTANSGVFVQPALRDTGVYGYAPRIDIGTDGIQVKDGTTIRAQVDTIDCTEQPVYIRWHLTKGAIWVWYKINPRSSWIELANGVTVTDAGAGAATNDRMIWGQDTTAVGHAVWRMVCGATSGDFQFENEAGPPATEPEGHTFGRCVPSRGSGLAYPVPDATDTDEDLAWLSEGGGGETHYSELVSIDVQYTNGLHHIHPDVSPSPRKPWIATGTSEVRIVYDLGDESWLGGAVALAALGSCQVNADGTLSGGYCDFRQAILQLDDGAGGVTTVGTLDKGWDVDYTLAGDLVIPRSGTATIDRYFQENELVGGYMVMLAGGGSVGRRITQSTAGYWTTSSSVQRMRIRVDGLTGAEDAPSGDGAIVAPSGVMVVYLQSETPRRYLVIKLASGQVVPDSVYSAGILAVARVVGVSTVTPAWGSSVQHQLQRRVTRRSDGVPRIRRLGPKKRIVTYGYDPQQLLEMRTLALARDYVGVETGIAVGSRNDAWTSPLGLLEGQARSGEVPCLLIPQLPSSTSTMTDPTRWVYGLYTGEGMTLSTQEGQEGTDEVLTGAGITVEEIR